MTKMELGRRRVKGWVCKRSNNGKQLPGTMPCALPHKAWYSLTPFPGKQGCCLATQPSTAEQAERTLCSMGCCWCPEKDQTFTENPAYGTWQTCKGEAFGRRVSLQRQAEQTADKVRETHSKLVGKYGEYFFFFSFQPVQTVAVLRTICQAKDLVSVLHWMLMWQLRPAGHAWFPIHVGHLSQQLQSLQCHPQVHSQRQIWREYCSQSVEIEGVRAQVYIHSFHKYFFLKLAV